MIRVFWTEKAIGQLEAIFEYIAQTSNQYARRTIERLLDRSEQIASFPNSGRVVPEFRRSDLREIFEGSYRLIYLVGDSQIDVLAVINARQQLEI